MMPRYTRRTGPAINTLAEAQHARPSGGPAAADHPESFAPTSSEFSGKPAVTSSDSRSGGMRQLFAQLLAAMQGAEPGSPAPEASGNAFSSMEHMAPATGEALSTKTHEIATGGVSLPTSHHPVYTKARVKTYARAAGPSGSRGRGARCT